MTIVHITAWLVTLLAFLYLLELGAARRRSRYAEDAPADSGVIYGFAGNYKAEQDGFSSSTTRRQDDLDLIEKTTVVQGRTYTPAQADMHEQLDGLLGLLAGEDVEPLFVSVVDFLTVRGYQFTATGAELADAFNAVYTEGLGK